MTEPSRRLVKLDPARTMEAARTLARAFMNDPLQTYTFPDPAQRAEISVPHFESMVRYGLLAGDVWVTEGSIDGVGIWLPPEHRQYREELFEEAGFGRLPEVMGEEAFSRFMTVIEHLEELHKRDVPEPHWCVMVLGVDPLHQGKGLGRLLLRACCRLADAQQVPCYLETAQPANVGFYTSHGFRVLVEGTEPVSGLRYWTFLRAPS
jgi:GNAT superfamily N-acetyltransferase